MLVVSREIPRTSASHLLREPSHSLPCHHAYIFLSNDIQHSLKKINYDLFFANYKIWQCYLYIMMGFIVTFSYTQIMYLDPFIPIILYCPPPS